MQASLDPPQYEEHIIEPAKPGSLGSFDPDLFGTPAKTELVCVHEGHQLTLDDATIAWLTDTVHHYEITAENRLLKRLKLLQECGLL